MGGSDHKQPGTIKGAAIHTFLDWYQETHDARRLFDEMEADLAQDLDVQRPGLGILPSTWYPVTLSHAVLDAAERVHGAEAMPALLRKGCEEMVDRMVRGVYRALVRMMGTPGLYARNIQRAWSALHSSGQREMIKLGPGEMESLTRDWTDHHRWMCTVVNETMRSIFMTMGYHRTEVERTHCVHDGHPHCRAVVRYQKR